ncbi:PAS domain-containing protein [Candidatus Peregrinibacteria bacterium]|nr:PAS domain-containing protein [Candidatus Peregrinibacteria bacterium]
MKRTDQSSLVGDKDLAVYVKPRFYSIGWRLLVYFFFVSLLPVFIIGYSMIQNSQYLLQTEISNKLEAIAMSKLSKIQFLLDESQGEFEDFFMNRSDLLTSIDQMLRESDFEKRNDVRKDFQELLSYSRHFSELALLDRHTGRIIVSTDPSKEGQKWDDPVLFEKGVSQFYTENLHYASELNDYTLGMSMPLRHTNSDFLGVFVGRLDLSKLYGFLGDHAGFGETGETYIVNNEGYIIYGIGLNSYYRKMEPAIRQRLVAEYKQTPLSTEGAVRGMRGETGIAIYDDYAGNEVIGYFENIPKFDFVFLAEQFTNEAFASVQVMKFRLVWILFGVLAANVILAFIIANSITRPLSKLTESAKQISSGDYEALTQVTGYDEFGILAQAFNRMSETLILSLDETKNIIRVLPNALFVLDTQGRITSVNQAAERLTEFGSQEMAGKSLEELIGHTGDGQKEEIFNLTDLRKRGAIYDLQAFCFTKYHKNIPISLSGVVLKNKQQKLIGFIVVAQDLSDIKASEIKLQASHAILKKEKAKTDEEKAKAEALLESIGEGIIAIDPQGKVLFMNQKSEAMFGRSSQEAIGRHYAENFDFEDAKGRPIKSDIFSVSGSIVMDKKIVFFFKLDNGKLPLSITVSPIVFEEKSMGNIVTFRDITKEMEVDKAKSEFVSLASHQLRTPLTGIKWLLQEIFRKGNLGDLQTEYMQDAIHSNDRMINLVNDLLNVSRLETGTIQAVSEKVDLFEFLHPIVREASILSKETGRILRFHLSGSKIDVMLDPQLIGQVITNLLSNAIHYTDKGKTITISAEKKGKAIVIKVTDEGIGISKEDQKKLFSKFFRSKEAAKRSTTGSGLGLYIVGKILDVCSGTIECQSEEGRGTTFIVTLPIKGPVNKASEKTLILKKLFSPLKK